MPEPKSIHALSFMTRLSDRTAILILTALALVLRAWELNADLWLDEIITLVQYMRLPPLEAASTFKAANQHLLNSVLGSLSIRTFGESAWAVRLPALLFGLATIPVFFKLACVVTVQREALLATLFLTLSYHHVWFSQNARGYTAMILFTTLSTLFLLRAFENNRRGDWLWFSLCGGLGMLSLLNYAFVLAGQFLAALLIIAGKRELPMLRMLFGSGVLVLLISVLGYVATLPAMIDYFSRGGAEMGWQNPLAFARVFAAGLTSALTALAVPALVAGAVVAFSGWFGYLKQQRVIALMLVLPAALNVLALAVLDFGAYPRSFLYILPFGILVLMRGAFVLSNNLARRSIRFLPQHDWLDYALPVIIVVGAAVMLPYNYLYPKQDYSGALNYVRSESDKRDVIAAVGYLASGYRSYHAPELEFPADATELAALSETGQHVWALYSFTRDMRQHFPDIQDYLEAHFEPRRVFPGTLGDGAIYVVVSRD